VRPITCGAGQRAHGSTDVESVVTATRTDWFGQPRGLTILFLTEMWDQFSFFGMRALLVLYMTKQLSIVQAQASWIYGGYAALVYLTPVFGGVITDRWLSRRTAVILGGTIMAAGHFMMASEGLLLPALATIAIGNGLFLPSLPSQIDSLYAPDDPRRKSAYNLYYVGINLGALAAPIVIGTIGEAYGFHWGFAIAGLGMIVALTTYISGGRYLPPDPTPSVARLARAEGATESSGRDFRQRAALLLAIVGAVIVFRGAYEQLGNTLTLWADQSVDRAITATFSVPVTWFLSLNPLTVFALTPVFVARWIRMAAQNREPPSVLKMVIGAVIIAISYCAIAALAVWAQSRGKQVSWVWLASFMVVMTAGELYILPVGLGLFVRLAPPGFTATSIAGWYFAGFLGNLFAGWLGTLWMPLSHGVFFAVMGMVALAAAGLLGLSVRRVARVERSYG
jgi:POT family proton-dependent oligopeptide transporter